MNGLSRSVIACAFVLALVSHGGAASVADTKFNHDRGFYTAPILLEITSATDGAQIRYTLDGSEPTATTGLAYGGPLIINRTTVVRAAAFKAGLDPTDVDTQSFLFLADVIRQTGAGLPADWGDFGNFDTEPGDLAPGPYAADYAMDPDVVDDPQFAPTILNDLRAIPSLCVSLDPLDLFGTEVLATDPMSGAVTEARGIYPIGKGFERAASAELILPDGSSGFQINCSVEIQGATSTDRWKTDKLSMRLKFKSPFGPSELDYPLFGDDATDSINTVILDATNQQAWTHPDPAQQLRAQYIRDQFVGDLQNATGGIAPHGRYAHIYLNGTYWGMYWLHEFVEESFTVAYRGGKKSDYDVLRHRADNVVAGTADGFANLLNLVEADLSQLANYQAVAAELDIPAFVDYILVNFYAGNADWAFQNWNASYHRTDPERKWLFHNWDAEKTFQFASDDNTEADDAGSPTHLHQRLRLSDEYRLVFADGIRRHFFNGGILTPATAAAMYTDRLSQIDRAVVAESARWGDNRNPTDPPFTRDTWLAERSRLLTSWFPSRTGVLFAQLQADSLYTDLSAPDFSQHGGAVTSGFVLAINDANAGTQVHYTTDGSDPRLPGGAISPAAINGASVTMGQSLQLRARVRDALTGDWSAITEAVFVVGNAYADLRVTEIHYNPLDGSPAEIAAGFEDGDEFEFIEITNTGASAVDLTGLRFSEGIAFVFGPDVLAVGDSIVVVNDQAAFEQRYGAGVADIAGEFGGSLSNSGEQITLVGPFGEAVQEFSYDDDWYPGTDGDGSSLVISDQGAALAVWNSPAGWRASGFLGGSPGSMDLDIPDVRITEVNFHPGSPSGSEQNAGFLSDSDFEFIELRNTGAVAINLDGFEISDAVQFTLPAIMLAPGAYVVVAADPAGLQERYGPLANVTGPFAPDTLSNQSDRIVLKSPTGQTIHDFEYADSWYSAADGIGASLVVVDETDPLFRWSEQDQWRASTFAGGSPGGADPLPSTSPLRISEIMFNPADPTPSEIAAGFTDNDRFEWIEVVNTGAVPIDVVNHSVSDAVTIVFGGFLLGPGERGVIVRDRDAFIERYLTDDPVIGEYGGSLNNSDEIIDLFDPLGALLQSVEYFDDWYDSTDGDGSSLVIIDAGEHPLTWNDDDFWRPSGVNGGTPGLDADNYAAWAWDEFSNDDAQDAAISGPAVDTDCDGVVNLMEYVLGTDPRRSTERGYFESVVEDNGDLYLAVTYRFNPAAVDSTVDVQFSSDAVTWVSADPLLQSYITGTAADGTPRLTLIDTVPITADRERFFRIMVTR